MRPDRRQAVMYAAVIGIEWCWLYALLSLLNRKAAGDGLSVAGILVLYPAALGLHALLRRLGWPNFFVRVINWLGWAAGMSLVLKLQLYGGLAWADTAWLLAIPRAFRDILFTFRPELLILAGSGVIWWMGRRVACARAGFTTLVTEFQFGLFMLLAAFFSAAMLKVTLDHSLLLTLAFFLISLLGISTAHALENTTWLAGLQRGRWTGLLAASVVTVIIIGFIISLLVTPDLLRLVVAGIRWVYEMVMAGLLWVAEWMVRLMPDIDRSEMPPPMPPLPSGGETESGGLIPETLRNALRLGWTIMMAGLLLLALWRISAGLYRWLRRRMAAMSGAEFEPMPGAFRADLLAFLKRLVNGVLGLGRFFRRRAARPPLPPEVATVRQIYRQFLHWAAAAGFPRRSSQTPYEYQYELIPHLETGRGEVDLLTRQYVRTRYGARPLSDEELQQLRQSWYNIRQSHPGVDERKERRKERLNRITGGKPRLWI